MFFSFFVEIETMTTVAKSVAERVWQPTVVQAAKEKRTQARKRRLQAKITACLNQNDRQ